MKKYIIHSALLMATIFGAHAATNPTSPGATSTGSIGLQVNVGNVVEVTGVKDLTIANWNGGEIDYGDSASLEENFCVFSNEANGKYKITFTDSTGGDLQLQGTDYQDTIPFSMEFTGKNGTPQTITKSDTTLENIPGSISPTCDKDTNNSNASLKFHIDSAGAARADTYTSTINLEVVPQV